MSEKADTSILRSLIDRWTAYATTLREGEKKAVKQHDYHEAAKLQTMASSIESCARDAEWMIRLENTNQP